MVRLRHTASRIGTLVSRTMITWKSSTLRTALKCAQTGGVRFVYVCLYWSFSPCSHFDFIRATLLHCAHMASLREVLSSRVDAGTPGVAVSAIFILSLRQCLRPYGWRPGRASHESHAVRQSHSFSTTAVLASTSVENEARSTYKSLMERGLLAALRRSDDGHASPTSPI
eukprot:6190178-Pleurochrysis_carterae.AAC.3